MIKPFIFGACDQRYYDLYATAFLNSARAQGHSVDVACDAGRSRTASDKARYHVWRFQLMPLMLRERPAVLAVDVDSIIRKPIEIEPEYDLGIFLRPHQTEAENKRTLAGVFYCTSRAMDFAQALADAVSAPSDAYSADQVALWRTYEALGHKYRVKIFDRATMDWEPDTEPCIYTAKGALRRGSASFLSEVAKWSQKAA